MPLRKTGVQTTEPTYLSKAYDQSHQASMLLYETEHYLRRGHTQQQSMSVGGLQWLSGAATGGLYELG
ncbi:hypothetical protein A5664_02135 [Mycolicibacterium fortuitum]|nr:hypothetical protein A5664_02135 [Mycolicibacterium fortuitum]